MNTMIELIRAFSHATGTRDTAMLKEILHDEYQVLVHQDGDARFLKKPEYIKYIKMMDDGKIGCARYELEISSVQIDGDVAHAMFRHIAESKWFDDTATALRLGGKWQLVFNLTRVTIR
jgi:hypothetical protein